MKEKQHKQEPAKRARDVGLQPQRTILSWFRTSAVVFVNALLLIKIGMHHSDVCYIVLGITLMVLAALMYAYSLFRNQKIIYEVELVDKVAINFYRLIVITLFGVGIILSFLILYKI